MHFSRVALALAAVLLTVDATFIVGTAGTVGVGAAYAGVALAGVAGLALGAGLVGALALRRGKRSVAAVQQTDLVLDTVAAADAYGCALKLVCLIESKPDEQLSAEDQLILQLFGRAPAALTEDEVDTPRKAYFYAAYLGTSQGKAACQKVFHACEASYGQMIEYVRALRT
ncbi:uncharacterized protein LOC119101320 [Pollicipes pollicipes]|uniref:uncharacterized protein LOC119101320 n=1 Tax=Pollicipes pollicipes TaxID=41117 RepID=UPI001884C629|nr:uncharacterized protein LOC119101320 [Pollicipes pollicipes]